MYADNITVAYERLHTAAATLEERTMLLRSAREVGDLIADGRRRLRWSQSDLAQEAGVSRQWVSQVENGKTTVAFDLVLGVLHALGYAVYAQSKDWIESNRSPGEGAPQSFWTQQQDVSSRTPLTRKGRSLRTKRRDEATDE